MWRVEAASVQVCDEVDDDESDVRGKVEESENSVENVRKFPARTPFLGNWAAAQLMKVAPL
jgi:hypothetical protein